MFSGVIVTETVFKMKLLPTFRSFVCLSTSTCTFRVSSFCAALVMTCCSAVAVISARSSSRTLLRA